LDFFDEGRREIKSSLLFYGARGAEFYGCQITRGQRFSGGAFKREGDERVLHTAKVAQIHPMAFTTTPGIALKRILTSRVGVT
jgi:hypothetical protein